MCNDKHLLWFCNQHDQKALKVIYQYMKKRTTYCSHEPPNFKRLTQPSFNFQLNFQSQFLPDPITQVHKLIQKNSTYTQVYSFHNC